MVNGEHEPVPAEVLPFEDKPREHCGVVGIYDPEGEAVPSAYAAIESLQHRGQDGVGISYAESGVNGEQYIETVKALGRVASAFEGGEALKDINNSEYATAHVRYGTTKEEDPYEALHPLKFEARGDEYTVAHNGQFDMDVLSRVAVEHGVLPRGTDSELFASVLKTSTEYHGQLEPALHNLLPQMDGAFSLSILGPEGVYGVRDRHGVRPLVLGTNDRASMVASEVRALTAPDHDGNQLDFEFKREVNPGTYVVINEHGIREQRWAEEDKKACLFEPVYLSKPENTINGTKVEAYRYRAGEMLAAADQEDGLEADMVVPVLGSAKVYAKGYEAISAIHYEEAIAQNKPDRIFIEKTQQAREAAIQQKFSIDENVELEGKSVVLLDDSLVRGTTMGGKNELVQIKNGLVQMLRNAGASEIHIRIGSDVYSKPCTFGVNVQSEEELLAYGRTVDEMAELLGADSLKFLPLEKMHEAAGVKADEVCDGCMGGSYPEPEIRRPDEIKLPLALVS
jgi:amidophosphoribosyltransferase